MLSEPKKQGNTNELLANERTFLAWIRTSIGIMAFGFVVVKFSIFIKQIALLIDADHIGPTKGNSGILGISLVAVGALIALLSYFNYRKTKIQLNTGNYKHSSLLITLLAAFILLISILLIVYLVNSI